MENNRSLKAKLNKIREPRTGRSMLLDIGASFLILIFGIALGILSKYLDGMDFDHFNFLLSIAARLDLGNVLTEMAIWLVMALAISALSRSPLKAARNVFLCFGGMDIRYHLSSVLIKGFDPGSYMLIWYGITLVSPILGIICWYARGDSIISILLDIPILTILSCYCFSVGWFYFYFRSALYTILFLIGVLALYKSPKQILIAGAMGILLSLLVAPMLPFN
jgi:hypothetical protein